MATIEWTNTNGGTWTTASDWSGGSTPGPADNAVIKASSADQYQIAVESAVAVRSLVLDELGATLIVGDLAAPGSLAAGKISLLFGTIALGGGTLTGSIVQGREGHFSYGDYGEPGSTLNAVTWEGNFAPMLTGDGPNTLLSITNGLTLTGANGTGSGRMTLDYGASLQFDGVQTLDNASVVLQGTYTSLGNASGIFAASEDQTAANLTFGQHLAMQANGAALLGTDGAMTNDGTLTVAPPSGRGAIGALHIEGSGTFTNDGLIDINQGSLVESIGDFVNAGTILVTKGTLTLTESATSTWSNTGTIDSAGGSVFFAGTTTVAQLDSFEATDGGKLGLSGTLLNAGGTLTLGTAALPSLSLGAGGDIVGGTIAGGQGKLAITGGTLSGVTSLGNLAIAGLNDTLTVAGGIVLDSAAGTQGGTLSATGEFDTLQFLGSQALTDIKLNVGNVNGGTLDIGTGFVSTGGVTTLTLAGTSTLDLVGGEDVSVIGDTLVNDALIEGPGSSSATFNLVAFTNAGAMKIDAAASKTSQISIAAGSFSNTGTITIGSNATLSFAPVDYPESATETWTSTGKVVVAANASLILGGTLTTASLKTIHAGTGALVSLSGTLQNVGQKLAIGTAALKQLELSGTIIGGTISATTGALAFAGGTLSGVTYGSALNLDTAASAVTITNGLAFSGAGPWNISLEGAGSTLTFLGSESLNKTTVNIGAATLAVDAGTLSLGAHSELVQGGSTATSASLIGLGAGAALVSAGTIDASATGGSLSVVDLDLTNAGSFTISGGALVQFAGSTFDNTGTLTIADQQSHFIVGEAGAAANFDNAGSIQIEGGFFEDGPQGTQTDQPGFGWTNTGTILVSGGELGLNEAYTTAGLGKIEVEGGSIVLAGQISNTGATLMLGTGSTLGNLVLAGGSIVSGTVMDANGASNSDYISGFGLVQASLANTGTFSAAGGTLTEQGNISGQGTLLATSHSTLILDGNVSAGQAAAFAGTHATIALQPMSFLGEISGFSQTDMLDLMGVNASAADFSGSSIVVTLSAGGTLSLQTTSALSGSLSVTGDGHGGTDLTFGASVSHGSVVYERFQMGAAKAIFWNGDDGVALHWAGRE